MSIELRDATPDDAPAITESLAPELGDLQERLFEDAGGDEHLRYQLAIYLHDHHPRTAHPPKPTTIA